MKDYFPRVPAGERRAKQALVILALDVVPNPLATKRAAEANHIPPVIMRTAKALDLMIALKAPWHSRVNISHSAAIVPTNLPYHLGNQQLGRSVSTNSRNLSGAGTSRKPTQADKARLAAEF